MSFPTTGVLDDFQRANEGPPPSASWGSTGVNDPSPALSVVSNGCKDAGAINTGGWWGTSFGPDSEAYTTLTTLMGNGIGVRAFLRLAQQGNTTVDGYRAGFTRNDSLPGFTTTLHRIDNGSSTQLGASNDDTSGTISAGIKIGADIIGSTLSIYVNKSGSWVSANSNTGDTTYAGAGVIGVSPLDSVQVLDDFGGGTVVTGGATPFRTDRIRSRRTSW